MQLAWYPWFHISSALNLSFTTPSSVLLKKWFAWDTFSMPPIDSSSFSRGESSLDSLCWNKDKLEFNRNTLLSKTDAVPRDRKQKTQTATAKCRRIGYLPHPLLSHIKLPSFTSILKQISKISYRVKIWVSRKHSTIKGGKGTPQLLYQID